MSRTVLDTDVLASGFARSNPSAAPTQLLDAWRAGAYTLVLSDHVLAELENTFADPYFTRRIEPAQARANLHLLRTEAIITPLTAMVRGIATHPEDDLMLATAVSAQADYLVTGDRKLQRLGAYAGIAILSPRAYLEVLQVGQDEPSP